MSVSNTSRPSHAGRIRRGPMAADAMQRDFTQIHNRLFRDTRISFKAKGIFGLISTHRDGYGVSPEWIAAASTDGVAAVKTGLRELEQHGYLVREQERRTDGTRGPMTYSITDMPSSQPQVENRSPAATCGDTENPRSAPVGDYPPADEPPADDRAHKKTSTKNASGKNTIRPSVRDAGGARATVRPGTAGTDGGNDDQEQQHDDRQAPRGGEAPAAATPAASPGLMLLLELGRQVPALAFGGKALADQGARVDELLAGGWRPEQLHQAVCAGLPAEGVRNPGGFISGRLARLPLCPPALPRQAEPGTGPQEGPERPPRRPDGTPTAHDRTAAEALSLRVQHECPGQDGLCGRPVPIEGALCGSCRTMRCATPGCPGTAEDDGLCGKCAESAAVYARQLSAIGSTGQREASWT